MYHGASGNENDRPVKLAVLNLAVQNLTRSVPTRYKPVLWEITLIYFGKAGKVNSEAWNGWRARDRSSEDGKSVGGISKLVRLKAALDLDAQ